MLKKKFFFGMIRIRTGIASVSINGVVYMVGSWSADSKSGKVILPEKEKKKPQFIFGLTSSFFFITHVKTTFI